MTWVEKVSDLKRDQYSKKDALKYVEDLFSRKKTGFTTKHKLKFEVAWRKPVVLNPTVEDIIPEIDLPSDFSKLKPNQEIQIKNYFKHLDKADMARRWKLIEIAVNIANAKKRKKDIETFRILSNLVYESKMIRKTATRANSAEEENITMEDYPSWQPQ